MKSDVENMFKITVECHLEIKLGNFFVCFTAFFILTLPFFVETNKFFCLFFFDFLSWSLSYIKYVYRSQSQNLGTIVIDDGNKKKAIRWSNSILPRGRRGMLHTSVILYTSVRQSVYDEICCTPRCHKTLSYTCTVVYDNFVVHCHKTLLYT